MRKKLSQLSAKAFEGKRSMFVRKLILGAFVFGSFRLQKCAPGVNCPCAPTPSPIIAQLFLDLVQILFLSTNHLESLVHSNLKLKIKKTKT